jgi:hypothetical protein
MGVVPLLRERVPVPLLRKTDHPLRHMLVTFLHLNRYGAIEELLLNASSHLRNHDNGNDILDGLIDIAIKWPAMTSIRAGAIRGYNRDVMLAVKAINAQRTLAPPTPTAPPAATPQDLVTPLPLIRHCHCYVRKELSTRKNTRRQPLSLIRPLRPAHLLRPLLLLRPLPRMRRTRSLPHTLRPEVLPLLLLRPLRPALLLRPLPAPERWRHTSRSGS